MISSIKDVIGSRVEDFRRTWFNTGYVDYLVKDRQNTERDLDEQMVSLVGRLAANGLIDVVSDEELIFRDQLFELERGRIELSLGKVAVEQ